MSSSRSPKARIREVKPQRFTNKSQLFVENHLLMLHISLGRVVFPCFSSPISTHCLRFSSHRAHPGQVVNKIREGLKLLKFKAAHAQLDPPTSGRCCHVFLTVTFRDMKTFPLVPLDVGVILSEIYVV